MKRFLKPTAVLEGEIDQYIHSVQKSALILYEGIRDYFQQDFELFEKRVDELRKLEDHAANLKRAIKTKLYKQMLIPESRGDVLGLLETLDDVIDSCKNTLLNFSIERPRIPSPLDEQFLRMADYTVRAVEEMVKGVTSYFTDISMTNEYINKVYFYEREVDKVEERIKRSIFSDHDVEKFSYRMHIRSFAESMAEITDTAESVCERLAISVIKRSM